MAGEEAIIKLGSVYASLQDASRAHRQVALGSTSNLQAWRSRRTSEVSSVSGETSSHMPVATWMSTRCRQSSASAVTNAAPRTCRPTDLVGYKHAPLSPMYCRAVTCNKVNPVQRPNSLIRTCCYHCCLEKLLASLHLPLTQTFAGHRATATRSMPIISLLHECFPSYLANVIESAPTRPQISIGNTTRPLELPAPAALPLKAIRLGALTPGLESWPGVAIAAMYVHSS